MFEENKFLDNSDIYDPKFTKSALNSQSIFKASKKNDIEKNSKFSFIDSFFDEKAQITNNFDQTKFQSEQRNVQNSLEIIQETPKKTSKKVRKMDLNSTDSKKRSNFRKNNDDPDHDHYAFVQGFEHILIEGGFGVRERFKKSLKLRFFGEEYFYLDGVLTAKIVLDEVNYFRVRELGLIVLKKKGNYFN